eukprot:632756-Prymnesium_polylepis.1
MCAGRPAAGPRAGPDLARAWELTCTGASTAEGSNAPNRKEWGGGCWCVGAVCTTPPGAPRVWSRIAGQCGGCQRYAGETPLPCEAAVRVGRT